MGTLKKITITSLSFMFYMMSCSPAIDQTNSKITLSDFTFSLPDSCSYDQGLKMELAIISCEKCQPIKVFNFGKKPVTISGNIERWKGQLDSVTSVNTVNYKNDLVHYSKIKGIKGNDYTTIYGLIIPSEDGPYYFKSIDLSENMRTEEKFDRLVKSINYLSVH